MTRNPNVKILTKKQYSIAMENGINRATACSRVRDLGWTIEDAITRPVTKKASFTEEELVLMKKHKLGKGTVESRIRALGWERHRALTEPIRCQVLH